MAGKAILVETGWSKHWNTPQYFEGHPFLTEDAAQFLADSRVALVGIDSHNIDSVEDLRRPVHSVLLGQEIVIVEHMTNLAALPPRLLVLRRSGQGEGLWNLPGPRLCDDLSLQSTSNIHPTNVSLTPTPTYV